MMRETLTALQMLQNRTQMTNGSIKVNTNIRPRMEVKMVPNASTVYDEELNITYICEVGKVT